MFARSLALAALCGMSFAASAVTVDLRHEFIDGGKTDKIRRPRFRLPPFANGFGFSVEAEVEIRRREHQPALFPISSAMVMKSIKLASGKRTKNFSVTPGFNIESNDSRSIYKPNPARASTALIMATTLLPLSL